MGSPKQSASSYAASTTSTEYSYSKGDSSSSRKSQSPSKLSSVKNALKPESKESRAARLANETPAQKQARELNAKAKHVTGPQ